jgi:hypothetical protein
MPLLGNNSPVQVGLLDDRVDPGSANPILTATVSLWPPSFFVPSLATMISALLGNGSGSGRWSLSASLLELTGRDSSGIARQAYCGAPFDQI